MLMLLFIPIMLLLHKKRQKKVFFILDKLHNGAWNWFFFFSPSVSLGVEKAPQLPGVHECKEDVELYYLFVHASKHAYVQTCIRVSMHA